MLLSLPQLARTGDFQPIFSGLAGGGGPSQHRQRPNPKKNMVYVTLYAEVDYNLTLCPLRSRLQHIYHMDNPMPESTLRVDFFCQSRTFDLALAQL